MKPELADRLSSATIMMVDDEPITMEVIQTFLEDAGYRDFMLIEDGREAMDGIRDRHPDLLLLDLMMPHISGFDILRAVREDTDTKHLPVLILTSSSDADTRLKALEMGATDFLAKPVDPSELALRVRNTLAAKAYQDRLAYYDEVTGLPNRKLFHQSLEDALRRPGPGKIGVLCVAISRIGEVSSTLGNETADRVLRRIGNRIDTRSMELKNGDGRSNPGLRGLVARGQAAEFYIFLDGMQAMEEAELLSHDVLGLLAKPFEVASHRLVLGANVGLVAYPDDGTEAETLMEVARSAAHQGRDLGNPIQFHSAELSSQARERLALEGQLRTAMEQDQLVLWYQPKFDAGQRVVGGEALVRWQHPQRGLLAPGHFIPLAEELGLIGKLGDWVLSEVCRQYGKWRRAGMRPLHLSVNIASEQFHREDFSQYVRSVVQAAGLEPDFLVLELTEGTLMNDAEATIRTMGDLKKQGFPMSIDDFGTGYSSFSYLKRFSMNELKIDKSFVDDLAHGEQDRKIVSAIIGLAHSLGIRVVAEGVETEVQFDFLVANGTDEFQGYLFSKPLPAREFLALLSGEPRERTGWP